MRDFGLENINFYFDFLGSNSMDMCKIYGLFYAVALVSSLYFNIVRRRRKKKDITVFRALCSHAYSMCVVAH